KGQAAYSGKLGANQVGQANHKDRGGRDGARQQERSNQKQYAGQEQTGDDGNENGVPEVKRKGIAISRGVFHHDLPRAPRTERRQCQDQSSTCDEGAVARGTEQMSYDDKVAELGAQLQSLPL